MTLVAEGVESATDLRQLADLGCDIAQGFHISRPQSAELLTAWLHEHHGSGPRPPQAELVPTPREEQGAPAP